MKLDWRQCYQHAKSPFGLSIILHIIIIATILLASVQQHKVYQVTIRTVQAGQPVKVVEASVISQAAYDRQQRRRQYLEQQKIARQHAAERRAELAAKKKREQAIARRKAYLKKRAAERAARQVALQKRKQRQEEARRRAQQKQRQLAAKRLQQKKQLARKKRAEKLAKQRAIADKLKRQALSSIGQQIAADQKAQQAAQARQQWLTERQKYIGLIQQTIRSNWINQFSQSDQLTVVLSISLNLQGQVGSVQIIKSSGNSAFDRQAVLAVRKSSPLPMPKDKALAKQFEHIKLPFSNIA